MKTPFKPPPDYTRREVEAASGELRLSIAMVMHVNRAHNLIELHFNEPVTGCLSASPEQIRAIAIAMLRSASRLDGKIV
jgi:hypothetical protein